MKARELLQRVTGLNLSEAEVRRAIDLRMRELGLERPSAYLQLLAPGQPELQALTELVVVPESWMFRDPLAFTCATAFIERRLAGKPGRLVRIASIPCAGGEEPYSMAMALHEAGVPRGAYSIDGFDLSDVSIARARRGRYTRNAFRGHLLDFRSRYFTLDDNEYLINDAIREQVNFRQGNLLAPDFAARPGHYDVIFCRNLLIYFDEPTTAAAIGNLSTLLADDGLLLAGYAEVPSFCRNGFAALREPGAFALVKAAAAKAPGAPLLERRGAQQSAPPVERRAAPMRPGAAIPARVRPPAAVPRPAPTVSPAAPVAPAPPALADLLAQARRQADLGNFEEAATACRTVLAAAPDAADAHFILGIISDCQQQGAAAAEHWRRCVYLQPDHYEALCHLALQAEQGGDAAQAASYKQRAARIYQRMQDGAAHKGKGRP